MSAGSFACLYEDPAYVPLLRRAYELWDAAETASGETLLVTTGSLDGGLEDDPLFRGALASAETHDLAHEVLTGAEVNQRYPGYRMPGAYRFVLQPQGGLIASERAIVAHARLAQEAGATIQARERVVEWQADPSGDGVTVRTDKGQYRAGRLVLAAGAWMADLAPVLAGLAVPERQVLAWLQPTRPELFTTERFPVFNLQVDEGRYYGFPVYEVPGFKFGRYHHRGETMPVEAMRREPDAEDERLLRGFAERYFPAGAGPTMALRACMFTNTPDEHFVLDRHPAFSTGDPGVAVQRGRLQVLFSDRGDPGRPGDRNRADSSRHQFPVAWAAEVRHDGGERSGMTPRRTLLFLPALAERFIAGAHEKGTGRVMLDLEDSIPMEQKQAARMALPAAVASLRQRGLGVWIRLNNRPQHLWLDVAACVLDGVSGLMLPKTERVAELTALDDAISRAEAKAGLAPGAVMAAAQIETPLGVLSAQAISGGPRLAALAWGGEDYAAALGVEVGPTALRLPAAYVALAARAAGLEAWGPAWAIPEHRRLAVFERAVRVSRSLGMTGTRASSASRRSGGGLSALGRRHRLGGRGGGGLRTGGRAGTGQHLGPWTHGGHIGACPGVRDPCEHQVLRRYVLVTHPRRLGC